MLLYRFLSDKFSLLIINIMDKTTNKIALFDLDDTLIDDSYKFDLTFCECIKHILLAFETNPMSIDEILTAMRKNAEISRSEAKDDDKYKVTTHMLAMRQTYEELCRLKEVQQKPYMQDLLDALMTANFEPPYYMIPRVVETLIEVKNRGYRMFVVTVGSYDVQMRKLKESGLYNHFDNIFVVTDGKKQPVMEQIKNSIPNDEIWMIGNSLTSDIIPAINVGIKSLYIKRGSWKKFHDTEIPEDKKELVYSLKSIDQILEYLR